MISIDQEGRLDHSIRAAAWAPSCPGGVCGAGEVMPVLEQSQGQDAAVSAFEKGVLL